MFLAGFEKAEIVGTCEKLEDPNAPVWSKVHLENVEAIGCGTIASDLKAARFRHTSIRASGSRTTAPAPPAT